MTEWPENPRKPPVSVSPEIFLWLLGLICVLETKLRSSCLQCKYFITWTLFQSSIRKCEVSGSGLCKYELSVWKDATMCPTYIMYVSRPAPECWFSSKASWFSIWKIWQNPDFYLKKKIKCVTVVLIALGAGHFNVLFSLAFFEILLLTRLGRFPTHEDSVTVARCSFLFSQWEKRYLVEMLANAWATFCILSYQPSVVTAVLNDDL